MENTKNSTLNYETLAWGAFFIWWGVTQMFKSLPAGTGAIGIGLILLGLNAARWLNGTPASGFTTVLGILALVLGGFDLLKVVFHLPFELPVFGILLVLLGVLSLAQAIRRTAQ